MAGWQAVTTREQLAALDDDSVLEGYRAGLGFIPTNYMRNDQAYWHGYMNAKVDRGEMPISPEQRQLAREMLPHFLAIFAEKH